MLKPGAEYEWFLAIVPDDEERSADLVASAAIKPAGLPNKNNIDTALKLGYYQNELYFEKRTKERNNGRNISCPGS